MRFLILGLATTIAAMITGASEMRAFNGSCHKGQLDLFYYRDPGLKVGKSFPLWTIQ